MLNITQAMLYLAEEKIIHRDLSSRHVLVTDDLRGCRLAGFGFARPCGGGGGGGGDPALDDGVDGDVYTATLRKGRGFPLRWTAIEAIKHDTFRCALGPSATLALT